MYWDKNYKKINVTVLGAQTVDGPEEANGGAVVGTLLLSGSLVALLFWVLGSDS